MTEVLERPPVMDTVTWLDDTVTWLDLYKRDCPQLFFAALLITGAVKSAEAAIDESLDLVDMDLAPNSRAVLIAVTQAAIARRGCLNAAARSLLPAELHAVANLPPDLRLCFVLHCLAGLTAHEILALAAMRVSEIEWCALDASIQLAERSLYAA